MAFNSRNRRFTIYDMMEAKGIFASNPANADSVDTAEGTSLYKGPVPYPKMMYHPKGETRVHVEGQMLTDSAGNPILDCHGEVIIRGEQREIIWQLVNDIEEEEVLTLEGWHTHPADAIRASGAKNVPAKGAQQLLDDKDRRIAELEAQLAGKRGPGRPRLHPEADAAD